MSVSRIKLMQQSTSENEACNNNHMASLDNCFHLGQNGIISAFVHSTYMVLVLQHVLHEVEVLVGAILELINNRLEKLTIVSLNSIRRNIQRRRGRHLERGER